MEPRQHEEKEGEDVACGNLAFERPTLEIEVVSWQGPAGIAASLSKGGLFGPLSAVFSGPIGAAYVSASCGKLQVHSAPLKADDLGRCTSTSGSCLRLHVPLPTLEGQGGQSSAAADGIAVTLRVCERRGRISGWLPDRVCGEAFVTFGEECLGVPHFRTAVLRSSGAARSPQGAPPRVGCSAQGTLTLRAGVLAPQVAYDFLRSAPNRSLAEVALGLAHILAQPNGVATFLGARPAALRCASVDRSDEERLWEQAQAWVVRLHASLRRLRPNLDDQVTMWYLARPVRNLQDLIGSLLVARTEGPSDEGRDEQAVQRLTVEWIMLFLNSCVEGEPGTWDEARLNKLVEAAAPEGAGAVSKRLTSFGVDALPEGLGEAVMLAVLLRILEAEASEEVEVFTSEHIMLPKGRLIPGLAAVLRPRRQADGYQVFLYNHLAICKWIAQHKSDPVTREVLREEDIVPLTSPLFRDRVEVCCGSALLVACCRNLRRRLCWRGCAPAVGLRRRGRN